MQAADRLFLAGLFLVFVLVLLKRAEPAQPMPLIKADYQRCLTFHNDLTHHPEHNYDYRLGDKRVDRGIS